MERVVVRVREAVVELEEWTKKRVEPERTKEGRDPVPQGTDKSRGRRRWSGSSKIVRTSE